MGGTGQGKGASDGGALPWARAYTAYWCNAGGCVVLVGETGRVEWSMCAPAARAPKLVLKLMTAGRKFST